ncbi:MAG: tetratricopeptide repeat protein [Candidatus Adiutrix sp.]|jgi:Tfp pilus assembly protein PilF|nr:tetratricopeptide repeat protein [Candidatus Adiutrix sp.]
METPILNEETVAIPPDLVAEGEDLFRAGRLTEAKTRFQAATLACPGHAPAWNNLAVIALAEGADDQAEGFLRQALEIKADFLEARWNLVEIHCLRGQWPKAARELQKILEFKPADLPALKRLAQVYIQSGQPDRARELLNGSETLGAMRAFVDSLWLGIKFYALADDLSARDKLEKFTASFLKFLDGQDGRSLRYKLVGLDPETGRETVLEGFHDAFHYKEAPGGLSPAALDDRGESALILTIGEHGDWSFFREALRAEMRAEGGCLGDFTQTRKVLRREGRLAKYNLTDTLKYFRDNVGPCDCHVLRAVLV